MSPSKSLIGLVVLGLLALTQVGSAEKVRYDNYRVYKATPSSAAQLAMLKQLEESSDSIIFMDSVQKINTDIHMVVAPHKVPDVLAILGRSEILYSLEANDLQKLMDDTPEKVGIKGRIGDYNWAQYYELDDTYSWLMTLPRAYPGEVTLIEGGKSYERRSILGVMISRSKSDKPGIFIEAGIHAREWIAPAAATYIINALLTSEDPAIQELANNYNWYIFPHANPDGYVFTHTTTRLWRKTRTPYGSCFGADPNRNWGFHWNEVGASDSPCSDTYAGPSAFSELETQSLANYIAKLKGKIQLYISFHAYSQYLLYPYGHSGDSVPNVEHYEQVFNAAVEAVAKRYGTEYTGGNIYDAIYPAAGASVDWVFGELDVKMSFCYELRPGPRAVLTGFRLPAEQIIPASEEILDSITAMVTEVQKLGYFD